MIEAHQSNVLRSTLTLQKEK